MSGNFHLCCAFEEFVLCANDLVVYEKLDKQMVKYLKAMAAFDEK